MLPEELEDGSFVEFVRDVEPRIREALTATLGSDAGREATAEAMAYAWENWSRVASMDNPAGYLYVLGRNRGRKAMLRSRPSFVPVDVGRTPWVEPGLPDAIASLPDRQRLVIMLIHCFEWTMSEVAELLAVSKSTVQSYDERGMARLRRRLGVTS